MHVKYLPPMNVYHHTNLLLMNKHRLQLFHFLVIDCYGQEKEALQCVLENLQNALREVLQTSYLMKAYQDRESLLSIIVHDNSKTEVGVDKSDKMTRLRLY